MLKDVAGKLVPNRDKALIQGDFNIDRPGVQPYLRQLFATAGLAEVAIDEPTTPGGRRNDHILYRGLALKSKRIVSGRAHRPLSRPSHVRGPVATSKSWSGSCSGIPGFPHTAIAVSREAPDRSRGVSQPRTLAARRRSSCSSS
jgi:hypothetical protein